MVRTLWRCEKCWCYSTKIKCLDCYPSPAFPLPPLEYLPPKDEMGYKAWDHWYTWRYMMEWRQDPESIYEIGSEQFTQMIEDAQARKLMPKAIFKPKQFRTYYQLKMKSVATFICKCK